ncbi:MAG TPA: class D sortase [Candidatus Dormibacteraeota bacterium]
MATAGGLLLLILFFGDLALGNYDQQHRNAVFQQQMAANPAPAVPQPDKIQPWPVNGVDFAIRVPKLDYFAAVGEGTDAAALNAGPGHYVDTAWPGQPDDVGVAAHNVYWIAFDRLQPGDQVRLETRWGTYTYRITTRRVVNADDRSILVHTLGPRLTLTTCWPLWAGQFATQRLVFLADQVDPAPARIPPGQDQAG